MTLATSADRSGKPVPAPRRRRWLRIGLPLALIGAFALYVSPLVSAARLAAAVRAGDAAGVAERIDFPALRRSTAEQIVGGYIAARGRELSATERRIALAVGMQSAMAWLGDLISPATIADLLAGRMPPGLGEESPGREGMVQLPPLGLDGVGEIAAAWARSGYQGPADYRLRPTEDGPSLHFGLRGLGWKIERIDLPPATLDALRTRFNAIADRN